MKHKVKAVLFDIGGTLEKLWVDPAIKQKMYLSLHKFLVKNGININIQNMIKMIQSGFKRYGEWRDKTLREAKPEEIWVNYVFEEAHYVNKQRIKRISPKLCEIYESGYYGRKLRSGVLDMLRALRDMNLKLGCVSNAISPVLEHNLEKYKIRRFFDVVVLSCNSGFRKPHPAIFNEALSSIHIEAGKSVFVGDTALKDVIGAKKVGFRCVILIRSIFTENDAIIQKIKPDYIINSLNEVPMLLKELSEP